jgi:AP-3 complex subunit mu
MPDLTLNFNNPYILDDVSFHPCVRYNRYEQNRVISFVPPDGNYKLMSYRVKGQLQLPIYVKPQISWNASGGKITVMVGTKSTQISAVEDIVITIPFPKTISTVSATSPVGNVQFDELTKVAKWTIPRLNAKDKTPILEGTISLPISAKSAIPDTNPIIQVNFKVPSYTASGLKIENLHLLNERYKPYKGMRAVTKAGKYFVRS